MGLGVLHGRLSGVCAADPDYPCDYTPSDCDQAMGAGIVMNVGPYTEDRMCLSGPQRYITADTPDLAGTFSPTGSRFVERVLSVVQTCKRQGRRAFEYLTDTLTAARNGLAIPRLLPGLA